MPAKSFFCVSLGILALAAAYDLGASTATAQVRGSSPTAAVVTSEGSFRHVVFTSHGDVFAASTANGPWTFTCNHDAGPSPPFPSGRSPQVRSRRGTSRPRLCGGEGGAHD